jgi:endothelin-converting enzyme/putative endopeptidase
VGHELTHGFDDQGRQYDAAGLLRDWWTPTCEAEFERRADCVRLLYSSYQGVDALPASRVNGALTEGENLADMGGVKAAYGAHAAALARLDATTRRQYERDVARLYGGRTPEQLFFVNYGHTWCTQRRVEAAYQALQSDPHAPARWRVNGVLSQTEEFATAFQCAADTPMAPTERCSVW